MKTHVSMKTGKTMVVGESQHRKLQKLWLQVGHGQQIPYNIKDLPEDNAGILPLQWEKAKPLTGAKEYMAVGLVDGSNPKGDAKGGAGTYKAADKKALREAAALARGDQVLLVVVPMEDRIVDNANFFAVTQLVEIRRQVRALPWGTTDIYFFPEFLDGPSKYALDKGITAKGRETLIKHNVRYHAALSKDHANDKGIAQILDGMQKRQVAHPLVATDLETSQAIFNMKTQLLLETRERRYKKEIDSLLETMTPDLAFGPHTEDYGILRFFDFEEPISTERRW